MSKANAKGKTKKLYRKLVRSGDFHTARKILDFLRTGVIQVSDYDDQAWGSGVADYLQDKFSYVNTRAGFTVSVQW